MYAACKLAMTFKSSLHLAARNETRASAVNLVLWRPGVEHKNDDRNRDSRGAKISKARPGAFDLQAR